MHDFCLTIPYGMVVLAGGVLGFLVAGSKASLMGGGGSGGVLVLLGYGGYMEFKSRGTVSRGWTIASAVVSNAIMIMMGKRLLKTEKLMPALPVGLLALVMTFFYVFQITKGNEPGPTAGARGSEKKGQ